MGVTRTAKGRVRVTLTLDEDVVAKIDEIVAEGFSSRAKIIEACVESGLDDWKFYRFIGLTPRRMGMLGRWLKKKGWITSTSEE